MAILNWNVLLLLIFSFLVFGYGIFWFFGSKIQKRLPSWMGLSLLLLTILAVTAQWGLRFFQNRDYTIDVQLVSPDGQPVTDAKVSTDTSGEAQQNLSGWRVRIPGDSLPIDGRIKLYAAAPARGWSGVETVQLGNSKNKYVRLRLSANIFVLTGIVIDASAKPVQNAKVSVLADSQSDIFAESQSYTLTDADGRFRFALHNVKVGEGIRLHITKGGFVPLDPYVVASELPISVVLNRARVSD